MDKSKWEYKKLGEFTSIRTGKLDANAADVNGVYPFFTCSKEPLSINSYSYDCECLLIAGNGDLNVKYYNGKFDAYQRTYIIQLKNDVEGIDMHYLYLFFSKYIEILRKKSIGGVIKYIKLGDLTEAIVPIYSIEDQQRIVAELDCLNEMIALKQEQLKEFDKLAQSIFYDMFGDSDGYEKVKLGDVVEVVSGLVDPNTEPYCSQLHVSPANIVGGTNEIVNCVQAKSEGLISDKYPFKAGMILYSKIRPNLNKVAIARFDGICSADMYPLSVLPKANNVYITKLLSSKQFLDYAIKNSGRARMPKLNRETLFSYSFNLPPLALQQQFAEKIQAIESQKELVKKSIAETQQLLDSRMDYYFD